MLYDENQSKMANYYRKKPDLFGLKLAVSVLMLLSIIFYTHTSKPTVNDSLSTANITRRFIKRKMHMREQCAKKGWNGLDLFHVEEAKRRRPNILYLDSHKALYCVIPKTGCTNWKKVLLYLSGFYSAEQALQLEQDKWAAVTGKTANDPANLEGLNFWSLSKAERQKRLQNYTKFMVVREPFERLVSAYRNKLETMKGDSFETISKAIHKKYSNNYQTDHAASFSEFLRHLIDKNPVSVQRNEHWENFWSLCYPCDIDYDYILKLDTIEEDSDYLFNRLNIDTIHYPKGYGAVASSDVWKEYEQQMPTSLLRAAYKYLKDDYDLFGYEPPSFN